MFGFIIQLIAKTIYIDKHDDQVLFWQVDMIFFSVNPETFFFHQKKGGILESTNRFGFIQLVQNVMGMKPDGCAERLCFGF